MAAEVLASARHQVYCFDAMPSPGRKFLMAGKSGLNLTHNENLMDFLGRYGQASSHLEQAIRHLPPDDLRVWAKGLGVETFVGSSGRVFPTEMKAAPLLRAWLRRQKGAGIRFHMRHRWTGWQGNNFQQLKFDTPEGPLEFQADATLLALGGSSWASLGSDGAWVSLLAEQGIVLTPFRPANCGFDVAWSEHFRQRFAGQPVKTVTVTCPQGQKRQGEFVITTHGVEGSLVYALSASLRDTLERGEPAALVLDLAPGKNLERLTADLARPRGKDSLSNHLRRRAGIEGLKAGLLRECLDGEAFHDPARLALGIKALTLPIQKPRPMDEAISTAGGVPFAELDENLMLKGCPGIFCAGEMIDWEAPTGGYLLTACFATGRWAGAGMAKWLE